MPTSLPLWITIMRTAWLLMCLPHVALAAPWLRSEGVANTGNGTLAYREVHWQRDDTDGAERWVLYQCPDGRPFARKHLPAASRPQARGYTLEDARSGQTAGISVAGNRVSIDWKEEADSPPRRRQLDLPADAVIDAGFDAAVREHWTPLMRGQSISLPFLVPSRQRYYPVRVRRSAALNWQGRAAQQIEVTLDSWYGGIAPRLHLVYADADRRLLQFQGTSNLRDERGSYPPVTVRFPDGPRPTAASEWLQAWAQPLVSGCGVTPG